MSELNGKDRVGFTANNAGDAGARLTTRRAALRKLGITTGAALFGMLAGDDLVRAVAAGVKRSHSNSALADYVVREFSDSGVALAMSDEMCGVMIWACEIGGPCRACTVPENCDDCMTIADFAFCECQQYYDNMYPGCCDSEGNPNGDPGCVQFNIDIQLCYDQYNLATAQC